MIHFLFQSFEVVSKFFDDIYTGLKSNDLLLDISPDLANVFAMLAPEEQIVEAMDTVEDMETVETIEIPGKFEMVSENSSDGSFWMNLIENFDFCSSILALIAFFNICKLFLGRSGKFHERENLNNFLINFFW